MTFEEAIKLMLVSFDSTIKANLSVGLPLDIQLYETDSLVEGRKDRIEPDNPYFQAISTGWGEALSEALKVLPDFAFPKT